jgi:hypothetical protein
MSKTMNHEQNEVVTRPLETLASRTLDRVTGGLIGTPYEGDNWDAWWAAHNDRLKA